MEQSDAIRAFEALGQATRLRLFRHLVTVGPEGLAAGDIAALLETRPNTLSSHLSILLQAGMIRAARQGRTIRYSADPAGIRALLSWLLQDCCGGSPETCAPVIAKIACACTESAEQ